MLQIVSVALICACITFILKNINNELSILAMIMSGIIIILMLTDYINETFNFFNKIVELTGIESGLYKIVFKVTAIGYLFEFASSTVEDFGLKSLSNKLLFAGKIVILTTAFPVIYAVLNLLIGVMQ